MTGDLTLRTTTDITTVLTVSAVHGTGAGTMRLGTGTRGHTPHGDIMAGTILSI